MSLWTSTPKLEGLLPHPRQTPTKHGCFSIPTGSLLCILGLLCRQSQAASRASTVHFATHAWPEVCPSSVTSHALAHESTRKLWGCSYLCPGHPCISSAALSPCSFQPGRGSLPQLPQAPLPPPLPLPHLQLPAQRKVSRVYLHRQLLFSPVVMQLRKPLAVFNRQRIILPLPH